MASPVRTLRFGYDKRHASMRVQTAYFAEDLSDGAVVTIRISQPGPISCGTFAIKPEGIDAFQKAFSADGDRVATLCDGLTLSEGDDECYTLNGAGVSYCLKGLDHLQEFANALAKAAQLAGVTVPG